MMEQEVVKMLQGKGVRFFLTGSQAIVPDLAYDSDTDFAVLDPKGVLNLSDWEDESINRGKYCSDDFTSYRKGNMNLIVMTSGDMFYRWEVATAAAIHMGIRSRPERVKLFQGVFYGNW